MKGLDYRCIRDKIQQLSSDECYPILHILEDNNIDFTQNNNGILFNLKDVSEESIEKMVQYLNDIDQKNKFNENNMKNNYKNKLSKLTSVENNNDMNSHEQSILRRIQYIQKQKKLKNEYDISQFIKVNE
tara:strand:- start:270 stop:659 length:390 start_codon:yes stop_codon:yes gene_type:complete